MNSLVRTFLQGLLAFLPVFLTIYGVYALGDWLDDRTSALLKAVIPGLPDTPGLGIVIGILAIFVLGLLVSSGVTRWIYQMIETVLEHLPIIKDLYSALKQLTNLIAPADGDETGQVVSVSHPDLPVSLVGLMTRADVAGLAHGVAPEGRVAVYFPMSYQIGGYTMFVPREWVTPVDMEVEVAMRNALTGWVKSDRARA
jgi:uncharacterized membrane protein